MENGFFEYKCKYWDDFSNDFKIVYGVTYANSCGEAMSNIEKYYDNIENIFLQPLEPFSVYDFTEHPSAFNLITVEKR